MIKKVIKSFIQPAPQVIRHTCIEILFIAINYKAFVCIFVRILIDRKFIIIRSTLKVFLPSLLMFCVREKLSSCCDVY